MGETEILLLLLGLLGLGLIALIGRKSNSGGVSGFGSGLFDVSELPARSTLRPLEQWEEVSVKVFRQSGNLEREQTYQTLEDAYKAAQATFRRAKSQDVRVFSGNEATVTYSRGFHNGRGRQEGKRIGFVEISLVLKDGAEEQIKEMKKAFIVDEFLVDNDALDRIAKLASKAVAAYDAAGHFSDPEEGTQAFRDSLLAAADKQTPYNLRLSKVTTRLMVIAAYDALCSKITEESRQAIIADENETAAIRKIAAAGGDVSLYKVLDLDILEKIERERLKIATKIDMEITSDNIFKVSKYADNVLK